MVAYRSLFCAVAFVFASLGFAGKSLAATLVPILNASVEGARNNGLPVNGTYGTSQRYQQIWDGALFGSDPVLVHAISFRVDAETGSAFGPTQFLGSSAFLSTTGLTSKTISANFDANHGADKKLVSQDFSLSGSTGSGPTNPFDVTLTFDTPFAFDPMAGSLLLELVLPAVPFTSQLDAVLGGFRGELPREIGTSRMFSLSSSASTTGSVQYQYGLVAAFDVSPFVAVPLPAGFFLLSLAIAMLGMLQWRQSSASG